MNQQQENSSLSENELENQQEISSQVEWNAAADEIPNPLSQAPASTQAAQVDTQAQTNNNSTGESINNPENGDMQGRDVIFSIQFFIGSENQDSGYEIFNLNDFEFPLHLIENNSSQISNQMNAHLSSQTAAHVVNDINSHRRTTTATLPFNSPPPQNFQRRTGLRNLPHRQARQARQTPNSAQSENNLLNMFQSTTHVYDMIRENSQFIAELAISRYLASIASQTAASHPRGASDAAVEALKIVKGPFLSKKRVSKHIMCCICQQAYTSCPDTAAVEPPNPTAPGSSNRIETAAEPDHLSEPLSSDQNPASPAQARRSFSRTVNPTSFLQMPCHHLFHPACLMSWLSMQSSCPICRYEIECENEGLFDAGARRERMRGWNFADTGEDVDTDEEVAVVAAVEEEKSVREPKYDLRKRRAREPVADAAPIRKRR